MAEFCKQCSIEVYGEDCGDLMDLTNEQDTDDGLFLEVLCEGCGPIQVDHTGSCVSVGCFRSHN